MTATSEVFADLPAALGSRLLRDLQQIPPASAYLIAYSGGLDSQVLLHSLARYRAFAPAMQMRALHVHHGLSGNADHWASSCQSTCQSLDIAFELAHAEVRRGELGLEAAAREARYAAFSAALRAGEIVLLAHHQDDQAETLLLNLVRGSGLQGLAAMPRQRPLGNGRLYRPLLDWSRRDLEAIANCWQLSWIEDESNLSREFDRNYLRHDIVPVLKARWPALTARLAQSARWSAEAVKLLEQVALEDLQRVLDPAGDLDLKLLQQLTVERQRNLVRQWLAGAQAGFPGEKRFEQIFTEIIPARPDARPELRWRGAGLRRYRNRLVLLKDPLELPAGSVLSWDLRQTLSLPRGALVAEWQDSVATGQAYLRRPRPGEAVTVRFRQGGEVLRPVPAGLRRPLKKLLQEWGVPPWLRGYLPLVFFNEDLAAVPGYTVAKPYLAAPGEPGVAVAWLRADAAAG